MLSIDTDDENAVNLYLTLSELQKKVRYGVGSMTSIAICDTVFNDRFLAGELAEIIGCNIIVLCFGCPVQCKISEVMFN